MQDMDLKIKALIKQVKDDPQNPFLRRKLVVALVSEGLIKRAVHQTAKALNEMEKKLRLPERFYKPLITTFRGQGEIAPIEMLVRDLELNYDVDDDEPIKRMVRSGRRAIREASYGSAFPMNMKEEEWWRGPHLVSEMKLIEWLPGRIIEVKEDKVSIMFMGHDEDDVMDVELTEMSIDDMKSISTNWDENLENRCLEMGIYSDDAVSITFHKPEKQ